MINIILKCERLKRKWWLSYDLKSFIFWNHLQGRRQSIFPTWRLTAEKVTIEEETYRTYTYLTYTASKIEHCFTCKMYSCFFVVISSIMKNILVVVGKMQIYDQIFSLKTFWSQSFPGQETQNCTSAWIFTNLNVIMFLECAWSHFRNSDFWNNLI